MAGVEGNDRPLTYHYKYSQSQLKQLQQKN